MKTFLEQLADRMETVDLGRIPNDGGHINPEEKVVGVLSADLQRMYAVRISLLIEFTRESNNAREHTLSHLQQKEGAHDTQICERFQQRLALAECWRDAVDKIFWTSVRIAFPEVADKPSMGIREGWQVVYDESDEQTSLLLKGLLEAIFHRK